MMSCRLIMIDEKVVNGMARNKVRRGLKIQALHRGQVEYLSDRG